MDNNTVFQQAVHTVVQELDDQSLLVCAKILNNMVSVKSDWWLDFLCQPHRNNYDIHDAFCVARILSLLENKQLVSFAIATDYPKKDREVEQNNTKLQNLPYPFKGEFWGGTADYDGNVYWSEPIEAHNLKSGEIVRLKPNKVPLEVGSMCSSKLAWFLDGQLIPSALARWPYGWNSIFVVLNVRDGSIYA